MVKIVKIMLMPTSRNFRRATNSIGMKQVVHAAYFLRKVKQFIAILWHKTTMIVSSTPNQSSRLIG